MNVSSTDIVKSLGRQLAQAYSAKETNNVSQISALIAFVRCPPLTLTLAQKMSKQPVASVTACNVTTMPIFSAKMVSAMNLKTLRIIRHTAMILAFGSFCLFQSLFAYFY